MVARTLAAFLFAAMLALGGAGVNYPLVGALVQSAAILMLLLNLLAPRRLGLNSCALPRDVSLILLASALFLLLQLMPLPEDLWSGLPGRLLLRDLVAATYAPPAWRSLSLDPLATVIAALELLPFTALFIAASRGGREMRQLLVETYLIAAIVGLLLGLMQRLTGSDGAFAPYHFQSMQTDSLPGYFVNRNHQASFLLLAIPLAAYWAGTSDRLDRAGTAVRLTIGWAMVILLALGVVATASRAGLLLLAIAVPISALLLGRGSISLRAVLLTIVPLTLVVAAASQSPTVQKALARFSQETDERPEYWINTAKAARAFWPAGSGLGSFPRIYPAFEPANQLSDAYVNNAHNDLVEIWLEGGLPAVLLLGGVAGLLCVSLFRRFGAETPKADRSAAVAAFAGCAILLLHSIVDYPLRMMTIMAGAGLLLALLIAPVNPSAFSKTLPHTPLRPASRWIAAAGFAALLIPVWALALSQSALLHGDAARALRWNAWSSDALVVQGRAALNDKEPERAALLASRALSYSPLNAGAAGLLADAWAEKGERRKADRLLAVASRLGGREPYIQYALLGRALERDDDNATVQHADALLRTGNYVDIVFPLVRQLEPYPVINAALVRALAANPPWRRRFLTSLSDLGDASIDMHLTLLNGLAETATPPDEEEIGAFASLLVARGRYPQAQQVLASLAGITEGTDLLTQASLAPLSTDSDANLPFTWRPGDALGVMATADDGSYLSITSGRATAGLAASRLVVTGPGPIALEGELTEGIAGSARLFNWTLRCRESGKELLPDRNESKPHNGKIAFRIGFTIPAVGCAAQYLRLGIDSSTGSGTDIKIIRLHLSR